MIGRGECCTCRPGSGQTATIGYWQNKNGQNLLKSLNGGENSTQLGNWLAATFPNMFGSLSGKTNGEVASICREVFKTKKKNRGIAGPAKLDSQVMGTAFALYVTNGTLAGQTAEAYGFLVTENGLAAATVNVGESGIAFNVLDYSVITVMDALLATDDLTAQTGLLYSYVVEVEDDGTVIYDVDILLRTLANQLYSLINEMGDIG